MKCPHCGEGKLVDRVATLKSLSAYKNAYVKWAYSYGMWDCDNCGRGWKGQKDGTLISEDCTDKEMYDPKTKKLTPMERD